MPSFPGGVGLMIGIPHSGRPVVKEWGYSLAQMHPPMNFDVRFCAVEGKPVDEARCFLAEQAKAQGAKYLYFNDDDVTCPPHTIRQLIFHLEHHPKYAVAGGIYCHKSVPQAPMVFRGNGIGPFWDWHVGEVFDVSGIGMGMTLIRVDVFNHIEKPYFKTVDTTDAYLDGINKAEMWTEDLYFCKKVTDAGYSVMADGGLLGGHWDVMTHTCYGLPANCKPLNLPMVKKGDKRIIDIGCGPIEDSYKTDEGEVLRVDCREDVKPDYRCDVRAGLPFPAKHFDVVFSSHTLEHFARGEVDAVLNEMVRILKDDGELRMVLPNMKWAAQHIMNDEIDSDVMNVLYGAQSYEENFHKIGFTPEMIEQMLKSRGFIKFFWDFHNYHMFFRAWKQDPEDARIGEIGPIIRIKKIPVQNANAQFDYEEVINKNGAKHEEAIPVPVAAHSGVALDGIQLQPGNGAGSNGSDQAGDQPSDSADSDCGPSGVPDEAQRAELSHQ